MEKTYTERKIVIAMKRLLMLILTVCTVLTYFASCNNSPAEPSEEPSPEPDTEEGLVLRVGTYNIKNGGNVGYDMSVLAADILACDLDIVGLQEVDINTSRCGNIDTLQQLAKATGYRYYKFAKAIDYQGGEYGTAILSQYPITSFEVTALTTNEGMEARALGHAVIDVDGTSIDFFNTHLSYENKEVRANQFKEIYDKVKNSNTFIITGDFNTSADSEFALIQNSIRSNNKTYNTYSNKSAIDDIVVHNKWTVVNKSMEDIKGHSDHNLFWAEIQYNGKL